MIRLGCCGFPTAHEKYYQAFCLVELQQTFYQPPRLSTAERWRREAPSGFEFTLKAWQLITHEPSSPTYRRLRAKIEPGQAQHYGAFRPTDEVLRAWEETKHVAETLRATAIVFQCPASFAPTLENRRNLQRFMASISPSPFRFVWEPRGDWEADTIRGICLESGMVHCVDPFRSEPVAGSIRYYRLHGRTGYNYRYTPQDLHALADRISPDPDTYLLFNNAHMFEDAQAYRQADPRTH